MRNMWIRGRSLRPGRSDDEDEFQLDLSKDHSENVRDILVNLCKKQGVTSERRCLSYLNAFVKLLTNCEHDYSILGFSAEEILYCLRPALLHDTTQVRSGGLRALRYMLHSPHEVAVCIKLQYPLLVARSLDLVTGNDNERVQAVRVVRRLMCLNASQFPMSLARALVAIASGTEDRLINVTLAALAELCILNPELFISVGGVTCMLRSLVNVRSGRMAEALVGCLLFLQNKPETRARAGLSLDCLAAPYTDLQVAVDKAKENTMYDNRFKWAHITLLSTLRSWPGVLHFCHPLKDGLRSIVATLYLNQLDVRKAVLDLLYELLCLAQPEWSDEMSVALEAVDPSRTQEAFKLSEGFVAAEGKMVLPHLSKYRVNLSELHLSLLLYCFLEAGLLDAIVEVIIAEDTFLSVRATILLGELLHLIHLLLPPECCQLTPSLPNLLSYAVRGRPHSAPPTYDLPPVQSSLNKSPCDVDLAENKNMFTARLGVRSEQSSVRTMSESSTDRTAKQDVPPTILSDQVEKHSTNKEASPYISQKKIVSGNSKNLRGEQTAHLLKGVREVLSDMTNAADLKSPAYRTMERERQQEVPACGRAQQSAMAAVTALSRLHRLLRLRPAPSSLYLDHILAAVAGRTPPHGVDLARVKGRTQSRNKLNQALTKECDEAIKESGVLTNKDCFAWNWDIIKAILKSRPECLRKCEDSNYRQFLRRLVQFVSPSSRQMSRVDMGADRRSVNIYTLTVMELLDCLLLGDKDSECEKLLIELLSGVRVQIEAISSSKSAHDCMFSPQAVLSTLCQDYILLLGHLTRSKIGCDLLDNLGLFNVLLSLATTSKHDCYVKLIVSCLDYSSDFRTRNIMNSTLVCKQESSRLYATKFLRVLLRTPLTKHTDYAPWVIELLANQLSDEDRAVSLSAIAALDEACDCNEYLEALIDLRPSLLHLGDKGLLLLIRFISTEKGFRYMSEANLVSTQLEKWVKFNYKYVCIVEGELADGLTLVERNEDGRYSTRLSNAKRVVNEVYVPPHLYGQLARHPPGLSMLLADENIPRLVQVVLDGQCGSDIEIMDLKAALWALGHVSSCPGGALWARANGVTRAFVSLACSCPVYAIRSTAFHAIALTSTNAEGADTLIALGWHTVRHNRSQLWPVVAPLTILEEALMEYSRESSESAASDMALKNGLFVLGEDSTLDGSEYFPGFTECHILQVGERAVRERKSATLPPAGASHTYHHNRSYSESKADSEWPLSATSNSGSDITDFRSNDNSRLYSESSTSGTSSGGESYQPRTYLSEKIMQTLSPIPSTGSLATIKSHRKISVTSNQGPQMSPQDMVGIAALRNLHRSRRPTFFASPHLSLHFSHSAPVSMSPLSPIELIAFQDWKQMSPLVRPKHPDHHHAEPQFEVSGVHCPLPCDSDKPQALHYESSRSCIAQPPDDSDDEDSNGPCYQGICLPQQLLVLFPLDEVSVKSEDVQQDNNSTTGMDISSCDSETDPAPEGEMERTKSSAAPKRRHDRTSCLLCAVSRLPNSRQSRWRKVSASSQHRIRTETESSYGGPNDGESPVMLPWHNKVGLEGITSVDSSSTDITSVAQRSIGDNFKSRSVVRKEVLRLAEQLCNPILYKTCKQALLQLKQTYGDMFNDICVYSDVCAVMAAAPHKICARRFLQELFLDAPFSEIYDDSLGLLNQQNNTESEDGASGDKPSSGSEMKSVEDSTVEPSNWKALGSKMNGFDSEQRSGELEVIMESDARSESSDLCRASGDSGRGCCMSLDCEGPVTPPGVSASPDIPLEVRGSEKQAKRAPELSSEKEGEYHLTVSRSSQQLREEFFSNILPADSKTWVRENIGVSLGETKTSPPIGSSLVSGKADIVTGGTQLCVAKQETRKETDLELKPCLSSPQSLKSKKNVSETTKSSCESTVRGVSKSANKSPLLTRAKKVSNMKPTNPSSKSEATSSKSMIGQPKVTNADFSNHLKENISSKTKTDSSTKKETSKGKIKQTSSSEDLDVPASSATVTKNLKTLEISGKPPSGSGRQRKKATSNVPNRDSLDSLKKKQEN